MKILSQVNCGLEESEEEWALVEMLGMEFVIRLERGYEPPGEFGDVETLTLDEMKNYPEALRILLEKREALSRWKRGVIDDLRRCKYGGAGS